MHGDVGAGAEDDVNVGTNLDGLERAGRLLAVRPGPTQRADDGKADKSGGSAAGHGA